MSFSPLRLLLVLSVLLGGLVAGGCATRGGHADYDTGLQYTVQPGDTLLGISARYNVEIADIVRANHLRSRQLTAGDRLLLPGVSVFAPVVLPEPEPIAPTAPVAADTGWYIPRSAWAVQPIDLGNIDPMTEIYRLTVHHSGEEGDVIDDPVEALRHFERIHKQAKGWACIGYHFVISRDGRVYEARPLRFQGAHAVGDNNIGNIGVCLIGDFDRTPVPAAQREALIGVLDRLTGQYGIEPNQIFGHGEFKATDCPGRYLMAIVEQYRGSGSGAVKPLPPKPVKRSRSSSSTSSSAAKRRSSGR
jgi:hypothetical protein